MKADFIKNAYLFQALSGQSYGAQKDSLAETAGIVSGGKSKGTPLPQ